jgi:hypothetical protein
MSALFPTNVKTWAPTDVTYPRNLELVRASHVTEAYFEITAIENELIGTRTSVVDNATPFDINTGTAVGGTTNGITWGSIRLRLNNMEQGVLEGVNRRVSTNGSSQIRPSTAGIVGLSIRAQTSQTANLLEIRNAANTLVNSFNSSGQFVGVINGGTA